MTQIEEGRLLCSLLGGHDKMVAVRQFASDGRVEQLADGDIDADGSPHAYHREHGMGLDTLENAGRPGHWFGLATDRNGEPIIQGPNDPAPGFYVSTTAYQRTQFAKNDPRRYLDSEQIPFFVIEDLIRKRAKGVVLGCRGEVTDTRTGITAPAMAGDIGPLYKTGEISMKLASDLRLPNNPRSGGIEENVLLYRFWPDQPFIYNGETFKLMPRI